MKITIRPNHLGFILALLSLSGTTPVASEQDVVSSCSTSFDCPTDTYCTIGGTCLAIGNCNQVADCDNPSNGPYPVALCLGTTTCELGSCGVDCSQNPLEPPPGAVNCVTNDDCPGGRGSEYCASDGYCEPIGGCAVPDDCFDPANSPFPIAPCMGGMRCNSRRCEMDCSGGSDAIFQCQTTADCPVPETYCNSFGQCGRNGSCDTVDDCRNVDNIFPQIECIGRQFCENRSCGINCGEDPLDVAPGGSCSSILDCTGDEYCAGNGVCLPPAACDRLADCSHPDNIFMTIACVGPTTCESGMCTKTCGEFEPGSCFTTADCGMEEYCSNDGVCLKNGSCNLEEDCSTSDNLYAVAMCIGTVSCDMGVCAKTCDSEPVVEGKDKIENGSPVAIDVNTCASDSDCLTLATGRSATGLFCAEGVCMDQGTCLTDNDCLNPSNILWTAKKCMGYVHCNDAGLCDIQCGEECKNGSRAAQCVVNPCEVEPMCTEAVSCQMTTCDGECNTLFFDAAGAVVDCDSSTQPLEGNKMAPDANKDAIVDSVESAEESSATTRCIVSAILAAGLVATAALV